MTPSLTNIWGLSAITYFFDGFSFNSQYENSNIEKKIAGNSLAKTQEAVI